MSDGTKIEWSQATWNVVSGCTRVSDGCTRCYIERTPPFRMAHRRFDGDGIGSTTGVMLHPDRLEIPLRWRKPRRIFVCSLADLFHDEVSDQYIAGVFAVMARAPRHTFQVLTKRHARMRSLLNEHDFSNRVIGADEIAWPLPNVHLGVSAENQQWADIRIPALLDTPAAVRFISAEPLLGSISLHTDPIEAGSPFWGSRLDWVIVGGESGPGARPMHPGWARRLRDQCADAGVPFLFKQWGEWSPLAPLVNGKFDFRNGIAMTDDGNTYRPGDLDYPDGPRRGEAHLADFPHHRPTSMYRVGKKAAGRMLDGRTHDEYPGQVNV